MFTSDEIFDMFSIQRYGNINICPKSSFKIQVIDKSTNNQTDSGVWKDEEDDTIYYDPSKLMVMNTYIKIQTNDSFEGQFLLKTEVAKCAGDNKVFSFYLTENSPDINLINKGNLNEICPEL